MIVRLEFILITADHLTRCAVCARATANENDRKSDPRHVHLGTGWLAKV